ncbi:helix-turn-helix domain-containing protein [Pseudomonas asiatica]|uniref:helix-turn-helix domain-containing protein n=1 Tax=Pseudomonas asiatica TaxID=2219225 RepID=UPI000C24CBA6|nr:MULTISPECIES: helix-turn-helix transcriptional regulator [Pseudomonas]CAB5646551.1 Helix-turn-helix [Pseudomonas putida]MBO2921853.1 hypothetical protein [Pseudomonas asiatica]PJI70512.1 hypothetical protein CSW00_28550 [Pseudomonas sp. MR 02]WPU59777.1 helix-turn-helix domain-containing protein [Pseudomonas asiatica]CAB5654240.1 Helix-turn-helix [Pseudomonas putida]
MSLRTAFASALKFLRMRRQLSQRELAGRRDQAYVSKLEAAANAVTLEVSDELARELKLHPLSLLALTYASQEGKSAREILNFLHEDLAAADLLDEQVPQEPMAVPHPVKAKAAALKEDIVRLMGEGLSQAEAARWLGVSRETVSKHLRK